MQGSSVWQSVGFIFRMSWVQIPSLLPNLWVVVVGSLGTALSIRKEKMVIEKGK